jgi:DNA end-binding protein Ku
MEQTMSKEFRPGDYHDTVRDRMLGQIQKKVEGEEITLAPEAPAQAQIIDLMEALKASLEKKGAAAAAAAPAAATEEEPEAELPRRAHARVQKRKRA